MGAALESHPAVLAWFHFGMLKSAAEARPARRVTIGVLCFHVPVLWDGGKDLLGIQLVRGVGRVPPGVA